MTWTAHAKDRFFAPRLSELTSNGARSLGVKAAEVEQHLLDFALNGTLRFSIPDPTRQVIWTLIRRAHGAAVQYDLGRQALDDYLSRLQVVGLRPYHRALAAFELAVGLSYQGWMLARSLIPECPNLFEKGDGSEFQRLNALYNVWKHAEKFIGQGEVAPDSTLPIWLTNEGLEAVGAKISFSEIAETVESLADIVEIVVHPDEHGARVKSDEG